MDVTVFAKFHLWLGLTFFYSPGAKTVINFQKNRTQNWTKTPISSTFFIGFAFWGLSRTIIMLARTTRNCPGRMNTSPEQETSIIHVTTYSPRVKPHRYTPRHFNNLSRRAAPCGEAMPTRGRGEGQQSHAAEGWQGADATSIRPPCAL